METRYTGKIVDDLTGYVIILKLNTSKGIEYCGVDLFANHCGLNGVLIGHTNS